MNSIQCRLLVVGQPKDLRQFVRLADWPEGFSEIEVLEIAGTRRSWQFSTVAPPIPPLRLLAARWPQLTFLLDYDTGTVKGLAGLRGGSITDHPVVYPLPAP